ncbi:arginine--tRNA ligase [Streptomyces sp. ISL-98]|uniref:ArgS-related anticodon-binding protein NrtL n=1 Tax=Streptomyces sp. ISL-98 TaxID=2819192 RepID=UPI001BE70A81|nr:DALR anticodon-binding domain-containing protein [Streptomyces sp. ISL-98]MBT2509986.1 arginine--tRNA ligase [Streptomyces sp. ISL-98]
MTPAELSRTVLRAVRRAVEEDVLRAPVPERAVVERPRPGGRGDYASNVALKLAGSASLPAREVAEILRRILVVDEQIADVEITGPGFLNFTLVRPAQDAVVRTVLIQRSSYGHGTSVDGAGQVVQVAAGAHGDAVARLMQAQGVTVVRSGAADGGFREVVGRLGRDAAVWSVLWPTSVARPDDLLVQRESNPLFRVRYAHARARALTRNAAALGFEARDEAAYGRHAAPLLGALADYPVVLEAAARHRAPDRLARYLDATAESFFRFHDAHPVLPLGDEKPSVAHRSRLALAEATGTVLAGGLSLLGISAPEHL